MDRLSSIGVFVAAVELGSISAAADSLGMSSQLAGKHVRTLEEGLGIKLLNRTTRRQSLTNEGRSFYERGKNILAELETAETEISESRAVPKGMLRVSAPITFGSHALAPVLPEYLRRHPEVHISLCLSNRPVDLIEEGFDVVFRTGELPDSGLTARRLSPHRLVLCAAPAYLQAAKKILRPEDLSEHECLVFTLTSLRTRWTFTGPQGEVSVPITGRFSTDSGEGLRAAAVAGMGVMLQPAELVAGELDSGRLVRLLPEYEPMPRPLHALYAPDRRMTPKLRSFLDYVINVFEER